MKNILPQLEGAPLFSVAAMGDLFALLYDAHEQNGMESNKNTHTHTQNRQKHGTDMVRGMHGSLQNGTRVRILFFLSLNGWDAEAWKCNDAACMAMAMAPLPSKTLSMQNQTDIVEHRQGRDQGEGGEGGGKKKKGCSRQPEHTHKHKKHTFIEDGLSIKEKKTGREIEIAHRLSLCSLCWSQDPSAAQSTSKGRAPLRD